MTIQAPDPSQVVRPSGTYPEPWLVPKRWRWMYRFVLGRPMDNVIRTDSTFWHRARTGHPSRWLRLAGWERAAIRLAGVYAIFWVLLSGLVWVLTRGVLALDLPVPRVLQVLSPRLVLEAHGMVIVGVLVPLGVYRRVRDYGLRVLVPVLVVHRLRVRVDGWVPYEIQGTKVWETEKVRPVALAAAQVLQIPMHPATAGTWVTVPRNYLDQDGDPVEVLLPGSFTGADKGIQDRLVRAVSARLAMKDPVVSWSLAGSVPRVQLSAPPLPPDKVFFAEVRDLLEAGEEYRPLVGLAGKGRAAYAEMISDSPHIAMSAGPGAGKSTTAKLIIMQALRWGWGVVILDWKQTEAYKWAEGLPGVRILTKLEAIHDFGEWLHEEIDYRKENGLTGSAKLLVVRDEWNITADLLMSYWQAFRQAEPDPEVRRTIPVKSPALRGYAVLDFAGREFGAHDFVIGQRLSSRAFNGNTDIRECFGIRMLGRYTEATKKMLVGNMKPFPKSSQERGRFTIVAGSDVQVVQVPLITGEEAREFAQGGIPNPPDPLTRSWYPEIPGSQGQPDDVDIALEGSLPEGAAPGSQVIEAEIVQELPQVRLLKLSEMVDHLDHLGITLKILRHASNDSDSGFPLPAGGSPNRGYTYDLNAVMEWARARQARMRAEREKA